MTLDEHHRNAHGFCSHGELRGECIIFNGPLNTLAKSINANAVAHGFYEEERNFGEVIALQHSELSEALECYRKGEPPVHYKDGKPEGMAFEFIDLIIRALDTLHTYNVDIDGLMKEKMTYNKSRPYKHGKRY